MGRRKGAVEGMVNEQFWRGRRVFLTGHTGFKGSWLALWLQSLGAKLTGYALAPPTEPSLFQKARVAEGMDSVIGDIRDLARLQAAMRAAAPEIVIHMAAQPLVRYSYANPVETYATNVMGTVHVLEAARASPDLKSIVAVTSDKCYENREWVWGYRETDPMGGFDPYSNSKGCAELVCAAFRSSYFNPANHARHGVGLATARAGNVIGGGDWAADRLVPDILAAFQRGEPVMIRSPRAIRPWQHVLEPLRGYLTLAERLVQDGPAHAEGWNFGPDDDGAQPVEWIARQLAEHWGRGATWTLDQNEHPHEAGYLKLDISKARMRLSWQPALQLAQALEMTVQWAQRVQGGEDARTVTLEQISAYRTIVPRT